MSNEDIIKDVIQEKVSNNEAFTAFDITQKAKKRGMDQRHSEVKDLIHEIMYSNYYTYQRIPITIPGVHSKPILYYPVDYDIDDYVPMDRIDNFKQLVAKTDQNLYDDDEDENDFLW